MHVKKTAVRFISGLLLASTLALPAFAATGTVNTGSSTLRVRSLAGTDGAILTTLKDGTQVEVLATAENGWYQISYAVSGGGTKTGYVSKDYISVSN